MQVPHQRETELDIGLHLEVAGLIQIAVPVAFFRMITAGAQRADRESPDTVRSADIELLAVGHDFRVAVRIARAYQQTGDQPAFPACLERVPDFADPFDELGKLISEQVFRTPLAEQLHGPVEQVAGRSNRVLPEYALVLPRPERIIVGIGVIHRGNELIAEAQRDGRVLVHRPVELGGRVQQLVIHQLQNGERVKAARR